MSDFVKVITGLVRDVAELRRRMDGMVQQGPIEEVDAKAGTVRVRLGGTDDKPFLSPPIPYAQIMGGLKIHAPPSKGQQVSVVNVAGDFRQGLAVPMTQSEQNKSPSEKADENVITYGGAKIELRGNELVVTIDKVLVKCGGSTFELTGAGLKMTAPDYQFD